MNNAIIVSNLKKNYGNNEVLKGISFEVKKGEIFGILGINGAGKTTTLECIEGFLKYNEGIIEINGKVGIQLQSASLPSFIKTSEAITLFTKWKRTEIDSVLLSHLGIEEFKNQEYYKLSTGQKRRLHLALSLINHPDILFLDEPTAGLDVEGRISLHKEILKLQKEGTTIVFASHDLSEVESLCNRIAILNNGKINFLGTTDELACRVGKKYNIRIITQQEEIEVETDSISKKIIELINYYENKHIPILDIKISRGTLTQHFIELTKENYL